MQSNDQLEIQEEGLKLSSSSVHFSIMHLNVLFLRERTRQSTAVLVPLETHWQRLAASVLDFHSKWIVLKIVIIIFSGSQPHCVLACQDGSVVLNGCSFPPPICLFASRYRC